jgi:hypothetical protein
VALKILWTKEAISGYNKVIDYLDENWTEKEIESFSYSVSEKLKLLSQGNVKFRKSVKHNYFETLVTKHNLLIYRVTNDSIELITFWDTRQDPKKKKF